MGFMDKVKAQATQVAGKAQEGLKNTQQKKTGDTLLRDLGAAVYAERTGRATETTSSDIDRLVADLRAAEEAMPALADAPSNGSSPAAPSGEYTLDGL